MWLTGPFWNKKYKYLLSKSLCEWNKTASHSSPFCLTVHFPALHTSTFSLFCSSLSAFERGGESAAAPAELTEQKMGLMLLEVCHRAGGSDYLRQIYHIIQGNEVGKHSLSPAIRWLLAWGRRLFTRKGGWGGWWGVGGGSRAQSGCSDLPVAQVTSRVQVYSGCLCCALTSCRAPHWESKQEFSFIYFSFLFF